MKDYRSYMLGALFVLVLIGIWTLIARLAKQPIDSSTQNEQRMEIDDVQTALAKDGRIDLNMLQWTREPERCEIKGDTIAIITKPHADLWQGVSPEHVAKRFREDFFPKYLSRKL